MTQHNFKKKFGQNFLKDENLLNAIVSDAGVTNLSTVLEIGAGAGALTKALSLKAKKVVSYEIDNELEPTLNALKLPNVEFVFKDALKEDIFSIENKTGGEYTVVANLPYYITSPLIFKFLEEANNCKSLTIMVQKEVAMRMIAKPSTKDYGVLTVMVAFSGKAKITRNVGRQMFFPMPSVDSCVINIQINKRSDMPQQEFFTFIKKCFSMRRKTLSNCLGGFKNLTKEEIQLKLNGFDLSRRAETFSFEEFMLMFKLLNC